MPNLFFRFPGGRFHATPWGNHVNEGLLEWPPSPWRIVRALLATGFSKLGWREPPTAAREIVEALASATPTYQLPAAVAAHTRHWMPLDDPNPEKRSRVIDAFARVGRDAEVAVQWPARLSPGADALLRELVPRMSYLGRAESVVVARVGGEEGVPEGLIASPDGTNRPGVESITLLAPMPQSDYLAWLSQARPHEAPKRTKKKSESPFPDDAFAAVLVDTEFLQRHGWSQPPGSRRVLYYRDADALASGRARVVSRSNVVAKADTALLALASDTSRREVLPALQRVVFQAERLHDALVRLVDGKPCPELTGRDADGAPLTGHRHAHLLPLDLDADGRLDHVLLHAKMGLGVHAQRAIRSLRRTYTKGGAGELFVTLAGIGELQLFRMLATGPVAELDEASVWVSRTPFVPPRHLKARRHTLEDQVQAELASRGLPAARSITLLEREELLRQRLHRYVLARRDPEKWPAAQRFFGVRLELERPARGPISLGYGAHYGLGLMVPGS